MSGDVTIDRLDKIVRRFCEPSQGGFLGALGYPFDVSKPNIHDSKGEFLAEKASVESAHANAVGLFDFLAARYNNDDESHAIAERVCKLLDRFSRDKQDYSAAKSSFELIKNNARNMGLSLATAHLLLDITSAFEERLRGPCQNKLA